jgi:hypothetical protein
MAIQGTNGTGNQFSDRFASGDVISAGQLNDLINGISTALPQPYLGDGASISYGSGGTVLTTIPDVQDEVGPEQFQVVVYGNRLKVARGRVIAKILTTPPTTYPEQTAEYSLNKYAVYPTGKATVGSTASSPWASSDGYIQIDNYAGGGADTFGVYIIRNQFESETGTPGYPLLAIMVPGSDAETKSRPWFPSETDGDVIAWRHIFIYRQISITIPDPPYETTFNGEVSQSDKLVNYNCQRVKIATVTWNPTNSAWDVTQHLIGTITIPSQMQFTSTLRYDNDTEGDPPWSTWPLYSSKNDDWNGAWTGYDKSFSAATANIGV